MYGTVIVHTELGFCHQAASYANTAYNRLFLASYSNWMRCYRRFGRAYFFQLSWTSETSDTSLSTHGVTTLPPRKTKPIIAYNELHVFISGSVYIIIPTSLLLQVFVQNVIRQDGISPGCHTKRTLFAFPAIGHILLVNVTSDLQNGILRQQIFILPNFFYL